MLPTTAPALPPPSEVFCSCSAPSDAGGGETGGGGEESPAGGEESGDGGGGEGGSDGGGGEGGSDGSDGDGGSEGGDGGGGSKGGEDGGIGGKMGCTSTKKVFWSRPSLADTAEVTLPFDKLAARRAPASATPPCKGIESSALTLRKVLWVTFTPLASSCGISVMLPSLRERENVTLPVFSLSSVLP